MSIPRITDLELNELKWWSKWATVKRFSKDAYLLTSKEFEEPFFNRACFVECGTVSTHMEEAERGLQRLSRPSTITVNQRCSSDLKKLTRSGYHRSETMIVMVAAKRLEPRERADAQVREISSGSVKDWARAYLLSFYGEATFTPAVTRIVKRLLRDGSATLLAVRMKGKVAGVLAIYRTPHLAGIYCVGTVPKFRRRGIAGTMLERASEIAHVEHRRMILQTLKSDGVEGFYAKRGFVSLYSKNFMGKES